MYPNYNMVGNYPNMYQNFNRNTRNYQNYGNRLVPGGILAPLLLGGIAGYAFGRPNYPYSYPYNYYYNNFYYPPYYW